VTAGAVVDAAAVHGLAPVTGTAGAVGLTGLTIGGGYGLLNGRLGLAADRLLGAEVVLADGRSVSTDSEPELLWALRGGGGGFGVLTSLRLALHPLDRLLSGLPMFDWAEAAAVLQGYAAVIATAPDDLTVMAGVMSGPQATAR
jgi:FAD/FMN-containing dehydrogenase